MSTITIVGQQRCVSIMLTVLTCYSNLFSAIILKNITKTHINNMQSVEKLIKK